MSGPKPVRIKGADILDGDGSIAIEFTKTPEGMTREIIFTAEALFQIAEDYAAQYEDGWGVTPEDLEDDGEEADDNGGAGMPVTEPETIIDAEIVEPKPEGQ